MIQENSEVIRLLRAINFTLLFINNYYGSSSVEMYNYAVLNGCRLVELDCWVN